MKMLRRKNLLKRVAEVYNLTTLVPKIYKIKVQNNTLLTSVAVFNLRAQVLSILQNNELMQPHNFAPGYDIYTGKPTSPVTHYGEVHTGDLLSLLVRSIAEMILVTCHFL